MYRLLILDWCPHHGWIQFLGHFHWLILELHLFDQDHGGSRECVFEGYVCLADVTARGISLPLKQASILVLKVKKFSSTSLQLPGRGHYLYPSLPASASFFRARMNQRSRKSQDVACHTWQ